MFPIAFELSGLTIRTYGVLIAIGLFIAIQYISYVAKQKNIPKNFIMDLCFYVIIAGIIGARLMYVFINWNYYSNDLLSIFKIWEGGLVYYGGFIFAVITALIYIKMHPQMKLLKIIDVFAPAIALGHFFGRLGCFSAGCCYGHKTNLPWAVKFLDTKSLAPLDVWLHPTQLYEAFGNLALFVVLHKYNKSEHTSGKTFIFYMFFYGLLRFIVEFFRGDDRGAYIFCFSPAQSISLCMIIISISMYFYMQKKYDRRN